MAREPRVLGHIELSELLGPEQPNDLESGSRRPTDQRHGEDRTDCCGKPRDSGARSPPPHADRMRMSGVRGRFNATCLLVVTAAPAAIVASFELLGTRRT